MNISKQLIGFLILAAGCGTSGNSPMLHDRDATPATAPSTSPVASPIVELQDVIAKKGSATFRSYDGRWIGADFDVDISFFPGGVFTKTFYSNPPSQHSGTFELAADGKVTMRFPGREGETMFLQHDSISLILTSDGNWRFRPPGVDLHIREPQTIPTPNDADPTHRE